MGGEFAQFDEWKDEEELDWFWTILTCTAKPECLQRRLYTSTKSRILYENDHRQQGFEWIDVNNAEQSIVSFIRYGKQPGEALIIVCNFTPSVYHEYRVGVPFQTEYIEVLNSDDAKYGGSHQINPKRLQARKGVLHGKPYSISMTVPPLGAAVFRAVKREERKRDERTMCGYAFGRRQGKQAECLNQKPRKTRRSIWRKVQNHRFCPQQLRQLGNSSCRCADSIPASLLNSYIGIGEPWDLDRNDGGVSILSPYAEASEVKWYKGTASAIYENRHF